VTGEPILSVEDRRVWDIWQRAAAAHGTTLAHRRRVDSAIRVTENAQGRIGVSWSGGKDSTVMTHLMCVRMGLMAKVFSEKDDLDFPGEEDYVRELGDAWGLDLRVVRPAVSLRQWVADRAAGMHVGDDIHGRSAALSREHFYPLMAECNAGMDVVALGLRSEESSLRKRLRQARGRHYTLRDGTQRLLPIADWKGLDVYAYALANGIDLLPMYRCVGFMHASEPWTLRKSWWLPGAGAGRGQVAWLRRYYPSLFRQLRDWMPEARSVV
jgi:3'-phosphoadenosine 5'-phosphosulfate sulfotransferase (PAPS reductase)/FAD synthetase